MKKVYTTGNAINVANFELLIAYCVAMGAKYNPVNQTLTIANLNIKLKASKAVMQAVTDAFTGFNKVRNLRATEFGSLKKLCTRIINALIACGASDATIANAKTINRKIQGGRAKNVVTPPTPGTVVETAVVETEPVADGAILKKTLDEIKKISVSQQGFDSQEDNFTKLLTLLKEEILYIPNETGLTLAAISTKLGAMSAINSSTKTATPVYTNSMTARDVELYEESDGLVDLALTVKPYCLSVLDASNADYKKIKHIHFKNFK